MRREEIDQMLDEYQLIDSFPIIPRQLVHCVCTAETSYNPKEYYRHEPDYWSNYMFNNLKFWKTLYNYQFGVDEPTVDQVSKAYAASYGIMQVMYDIALDIHLRTEHDIGLSQVINNFITTDVFDTKLFMGMELPEGLNDDAIGLWYGMYELEEKMQVMLKKLAAVADQQKGVTLEQFMNGDPILFNGTAVNKMDFFKFVISSYQAGTGTLGKLLKMAKDCGSKATWVDISEYIPKIRSVKITGYMHRHIERAFSGLTEEDFNYDTR